MNNATEVQLEELTAHQLYCISVVRTTISLIYVNGNKNGISVNGKILTPLPKTETDKFGYICFVSVIGLFPF